MLYTDDIREILARDKRTRSSFRGVYAKDQLPAQAPTSSLYVCNTDPSTRGGEHWVVIYIDGERRGEFFDSISNVRPIEEQFESFLQRNSVTWTRNARTVQHLMSDTCGYHCVFFAVNRCVGFSMNSIVNMYTANLLHNDKIVMDFVRNYIK
jgi:hypothetical protein